MAEYGRIFKKFWTNKKIRSLSEDARALLIYLFTSPHHNMSGIYMISKMYMASDLQWSMERLELPLRELLGEGLNEGLGEGLREGLHQGLTEDSLPLIFYDEECQVVFIPSWFEHHPEKWNDNQLKKAKAELSELPNTHLFQAFKPLAEGLHQGLTEGLPEPLPITEPEYEPEYVNENEKEKKKSSASPSIPKPSAKKIIDQWLQYIDEIQMRRWGIKRLDYRQINILVNPNGNRKGRCAKPGFGSYHVLAVTLDSVKQEIDDLFTYLQKIANDELSVNAFIKKSEEIEPKIRGRPTKINEFAEDSEQPPEPPVEQET